MPGRKTPLITNQYYHILNRGIARQPVFTSKWEFNRAVEIAHFYQNRQTPQRYSIFILSANKIRQIMLEKLAKDKDFWVEIIAYCFMPNHFHFLLKQSHENGISKFMSNFTNSYTRYFNVKHQREGHLFQGKFKSVLVENDDQLLHLSRYIHLNPLTSYLIKNIEDLEQYSFSSLPEYFKKTSGFCSKDIILSQFKNSKKYFQFLTDQADYQKELDFIKHLSLEK